MRARGPYREPLRDGATSGAGSEEEAVHPYLTQALAAERVREQEQQATLARLARKARRARRGRADVVACSQDACSQAVGSTAAQDLEKREHDSRELAGVR